MEKNSIKKVLIFLPLLLLMSCASKITPKEINFIIEKQFKIECDEEITQLKEVYDNYPELKKDFIESRESDFNKSMILRNKVLDSLRILSYDKSMIVESTKDLNGLIVTVQYFFFNNKIYSVGYNTEIITQNEKEDVVKETPTIEETSLEDLKAKYQNDILEIYNHFNKNNFSKIEDSFECTPSFGNYKVTLVISNKLGYYGVKASENCRVSRYN